MTTRDDTRRDWGDETDGRGGARPGMATLCPYCNIVLDPPPTFSRACLACGEVILVRAGVPQRIEDIGGDATTEYVAIVGESFCQPAIIASRPGDAAVLRRERNNPKDRQAVAIDVRGLKVGYIARDRNEQLARLLDAGGRPQAYVARLTGGTIGAPTIGVVLAMRLEGRPSLALLDRTLPPYVLAHARIAEVEAGVPHAEPEPLTAAEVQRVPLDSRYPALCGTSRFLDGD